MKNSLIYRRDTGHVWGNNTEVPKLLETRRGLSLSEKPAGNASDMWGIMQCYTEKAQRDREPNKEALRSRICWLHNYTRAWAWALGTSVSFMYSGH